VIWLNDEERLPKPLPDHGREHQHHGKLRLRAEQLSVKGVS
jgi:hypothetical protein